MHPGVYAKTRPMQVEHARSADLLPELEIIGANHKALVPEYIIHDSFDIHERVANVMQQFLPPDCLRAMPPGPAEALCPRLHKEAIYFGVKFWMI